MRWLGGEAWPPWWRSLTLMFQLEVAERIVARPGTGAYGRLAVLAQWRSEPRIAMKVHRSAFVPPPKVMSAVVHIVPKAAPEGVRAATLERLTGAAFGQRRKMLRQSLKGAGGGAGGAGGAGDRPGAAGGDAVGGGVRRVARAMNASPRQMGRGQGCGGVPGRRPERIARARAPSTTSRSPSPAPREAESRLRRATSGRWAVSTSGGGPLAMTAASWVACGQGLAQSVLIRSRFFLARSTAPRWTRASPWPASAATSLGSSFSASK